MKKYLFFSVIFFCAALHSQNYAPFVFGQTSVYQQGIIYTFNSTPTYYHMFRADTTYVQGNDTTYRNYPLLDYNNVNGCAAVNDTNFFADRVTLSNGNVLFYNTTGDTIVV